MKTDAHRTGWTIATLLGLSGLVLGGCGGSEEPAQGETPQTSSAPADEAAQQAAGPADDAAGAIDTIAGTPERLSNPMER
ncbi:MAG: hypothetical protein ACF8QF_09800, partial [Phycisphaerales bacterium]